ncbi:MAG TPA: carboxyl transferase domain-containing protein [Leptospiraceae bacterium]|nr:carboxyl transferase domain-containing protein [Leptospiraceae bacterium]HMY67601.1 carboxyl transferase domain-containing protein [Leptospiraceae bacterium]HNF15433.1 carboxyl transferase domain-containing protein [Leptospiraceae bacterium]HNF23501.1 carboxyl transferase domain-containing protein [Leptospiraceae bacterium]HNI94915.1 carboxyl transferase domain-containing protein [Leptospiraceae bacterium]
MSYEILASAVNTGSQDFTSNYEYNLSLAKEISHLSEKVRQGGGEKAVQKHKERGKLPARERIQKLIDRDSYFLEVGMFCAESVYPDSVPSAGIITGIGRVHGRDVMIVANDATVKGGTYYPLTVKKHIRAQEIAEENFLPCVYLVDSGGAFLPRQDEVFPDKDHFGRIFFNQANLSAKKIPQIAVVMGSCTAGGAYIPAMCDETVIVKGNGTIFLGGPPLVKAATGEIVTPEELGGADVHTRISGVADHLAENDDHAIQIARRILEAGRPLKKEMQLYEEPLFPSDEILGIIPKDTRKAFDVREIIARIVDGSRFQEFKKYYAETIVTGFARIYGNDVGIIANNGVLFSESALKAAHFIELCDSRNIPIIFLQNITGFIVGKKYENAGIARDGAKLVTAVATCRVPKLSLVIGGSFGAGNYGMCGRAFGPRFLWMWPNSKIAVMGGEQAANVLFTVKADQAAKEGRTVSSEEEKEFKAPILSDYEKKSSALYSSARLWDDGIISQTDTRAVLGTALNLVKDKNRDLKNFGLFRM